MASSATTYVALLRGINVGGKHKVPMAELRQVIAAHDCDGVQSYIQSGNLIFTSAQAASALESVFEKAIKAEFGFTIPVVIRSAASWAQYLSNNPFVEQSDQTPNWVQLLLSKDPPQPDAAEALQARSTRDERFVSIGDAIFSHFPNGIGKSKITSAVMDRCVGSPVTARNWKTVLQLDKRIGA